MVHRFVADVGAGGVGVPVEADVGVLVVEARGGVELVEDVAPLVGRVERGVDDGEIPHLPDEPQAGEPLFVFIGEVFAGPAQGGVGQRIEGFQRSVQVRLFVVIAFDHRAAQSLDDLHAFMGIGVVTDDVADADVMGAAALLCVSQDGFQSF